MRKTIFLILILLHSWVTVSLAEENDFRNTKWGMALAEVKEINEATILSQDKNELVYSTVLFNKKCNLYYHFENNKLVIGGMSFNNDNELDSNDKDILYNKINTLLSDKYEKKKDNKINESYTDKMDLSIDKKALSEEIDKIASVLKGCDFSIYESKNSIIMLIRHNQITVEYIDKKFFIRQNEYYQF